MIYEILNESGEVVNRIVASPDFVEEHYAGQYREVPRELTSEHAEKSQAVRDERNRRLSECDWTMLPDAPVDKTAWGAYRQALRDITSQQGFPWEVVWPQEP